MHKKTLSKAIAVFALIGFIWLFAPGLTSAEKKASKFDFRSLIRKPAVWISSVWSWIAPVFDLGNPSVTNPVPNNTTSKIKPTGDLPSPRPSKSD